MVTNLLKALLVLFVFLVVMKNSERQFAIAKSVQNVEVGSPSIRGLKEAEWLYRCLGLHKSCYLHSECCSKKCEWWWSYFTFIW